MAITRIPQRKKVTTSEAFYRYSARMNGALDFISQHLNSDLSLQRVADAAHFSPFHFHRLFQYHTGETLSAFVTRVRLERAVFLARTVPSKPLTDIAFDCGFNSASNFSRTFKRAYGVSLAKAKADLPTLLSSRKNGEVSTSLGRQADDDIAICKIQNSQVRIERWSGVRLAYIRVTGGYLAPEKLIAGYQALATWAKSAKFDLSRSRLMGISMDDPEITPLAKCRYDFCRTVDANLAVTKGIAFCTLASHDWAVLPCSGTLVDVEMAWNFLFRKWLPNSGFEPAPMPALEVFLKQPEEIGWDHFELECCIPVVPARWKAPKSARSVKPMGKPSRTVSSTDMQAENHAQKD